MYKILLRQSETFPKDTFTVWYCVDFDGENSEWRECVQDIISRLSNEHVIKEVNVPAFEKGEDFVSLEYSIDGKLLEFSCDFLLYSIFVKTSDASLANLLRDKLADQVGWDG